jgi:thiol-disulfide isomerase/thioredoxin
VQALFNQYSYVLLVLGIILAVGVALRLIFRRSLRVTTVVVLALAILGAAGWGVLRPTPGDVSDLAKAEATLRGGRPTLLEFYSDYCIGCIAARATFDQTVAQMQTAYTDTVNVMRVDIHSDSGRALREEYGFSYTPEFVIFDGGASELWRSHTPPTITDLDSVFSDHMSHVSGD